MVIDRTLLSMTLVVIASLVTSAQEVNRGPTFEVASVRPNTSGAGGGGINIQPGGRVTALNVPLLWLIESAYGLGHHQLEGGPAWMDTDRFDVIAKAETDIPRPVAGGPPGPFHFMLRALLAERFKLAVHQEKRDLPIYELHLARADGTLGPGLRRSDFDCSAAEKIPDGRPRDRNDGRPICGMFMRNAQITAHSIPFSRLVEVIEGNVHRPVVDRTNLSGLVDIEVELASNSSDPSKPSIFTALQEQLGLKLVSARGPVEVLVVDHAERPTPD